MQRCLITGANRGLGLAFVTQLLERGARVLACCRNPSQAKVLDALAAAHGDRLAIHALDVANPAAIGKLPQVAARYLQRVDLLINNAGILVSGERFGNVKPESLAESFAVNATAPLLITQALAPLLALGNKPRVLCITTQLASIAQASGFRTLSYAMSKAALNMAVKRLAAELTPRGIVVLAAHPGWIRTEMGGSGATLAPADSAHALLGLIEHAQARDAGKFLAHDGAELPW
ncbi:MAG TPA: SDR family oxidoreductase [Rhodanobacteraceae bacterium]|jgi:NAD(P)-dependent dehydrogenase (short-subunit alcohol dehydrogenase family)|nr:SDR family oxidoreductase [Rhodanobacteraceae bacterium]